MLVITEMNVNYCEGFSSEKEMMSKNSEYTANITTFCNLQMKLCTLQGSNDEDDDDEPFVQHDRLVTDQKNYTIHWSLGQLSFQQPSMFFSWMMLNQE